MVQTATDFSTEITEIENNRRTFLRAESEYSVKNTFNNEDETNFQINESQENSSTTGINNHAYKKC